MAAPLQGDEPLIRVDFAAGEDPGPEPVGSIWTGRMISENEERSGERKIIFITSLGDDPLPDATRRLVIERFTRLAVKLCLTEDYLSRAEVREGSVETCRVVANIAVFLLSQYDDLYYMGEEEGAYQNLQDRMRALEKEPLGDRALRHVQKKIGRRAIDQRRRCYEAIVQDLVAEVNELARPLLLDPAGRWRRRLDEALEGYNNSSNAHWLASKLPRPRCCCC